MLVTEEEAKTKWCPYARDFDGPPGGEFGVASVNRQANQPVPMVACRCLGSGCMAWRWAYQGRMEEEDGSEVYIPAPEPPIQGYCGLAGEPQ